jgi:uncharacterized protein YggE
MKTTILSSLLLSLASTLSVSAATELKGSPEELSGYLAGLPQIVSLTGEGEVKISADRAEITLKVTTENRSLHDALRVNQDIRGRLAAFLKENGFNADQIQGARFSSTPKFGMFSEKAKSHRVDNFVKITVRDEKEFQIVAGTVDRWPEVQFVGVEMQHSGKETIKSRAQAMALDKAAERRKLFEEKLGVKLVAKRFVDFNVEPRPVERNRQYYGLRYSTSSGDSGPGIQGGSSPTLAAAARETMDESPFGELMFTARVTVEYAVEPK